MVFFVKRMVPGIANNHHAHQKVIRWNLIYEGGSICNENPVITPSTNALGFYAIRQTKDQSVAVIMVHVTLFYLSKFNKLHTICKAH